MGESVKEIKLVGGDRLRIQTNTIVDWACARGPVLVDRVLVSRALRIGFFSSSERYTV